MEQTNMRSRHWVAMYKRLLKAQKLRNFWSLYGSSKRDFPAKQRLQLEEIEVQIWCLENI